MGNSESRETAPGRAAPNTVRADVDVDHIQKLCHADEYDVDEFLVTRRGTEFPLTLHTQTHLTVEKATIAHESGNEIAVTVGKQRTRRTGTVVNLTIPANAAIGVYVLSISGKFEDGSTFEVSIKRKVVVLFNAWCTEDGVYVEDEDYRKEFVLNSSGRLYAGSHTGMPWNLALYRPDSLRAVMFIMENVADLTFDQKRNPILVGREMSAVVNIQDENGILVGRWDGEYGDGRAPTSWRGSGEILQKYYKSDGEPVSYGQCWVFSGVLLSVLRILGIPSRSVTNFSSAHDTNRNRTIDEYYDGSGEKVYYLSSGSDSVWNFHVWNEAWMARPDLPAGFDGWQVLDATPQEESPQGGGYRTGPAPVKAIKDGNSVVYDTNFVIAEVNADIKKYIIEEHGAPRLFKVQTTAVGKTISTKAVGGAHRHDITDEYKHPEGSDRERAALYEGYKELMEAQYDMEFEIPEIKHKFGEDVLFQVNVTNTARIQRVQGKILCEAVTYTGRVLREVNKLIVDTKVGKGKTERIKMTIDGAVFSEFPGTKVYLRFNVLLAVTGTSQVFSEEVNVAPDPPELHIESPKRIVIGTEATVTVKFKNPLPVKMDDVTINVESDELLHDDITDNIGTIGPGAEITYPFKIVGLKLGKFQLVVGLDSDKVELVTGETEVEVVDVIDEPDSPPPIPPPLEVVKVDSNIEENRRAHHTDRYEESGLIIRRGQTFSLTVTTKEPVSGKIVTRGAFRLKSKRSGAPSVQVDAVSVDVQGNSFKIDIKPPGNVPIGSYTLILTLDSGHNVIVLEDRITVIILFNPWSIEDSTHYPEVSELDEYVLNNQGRIWVGSSYSNYGRPWQFAQFKKDSLEVALWILDKLRSFQDRADAVKVTRHLSAWVNVQDDNGIVVGNWSGDYEGGASPLSWTGSADILAEYNRTHSGVQYGQCWVFSGVQTSLLRCVGLPARSVSNFNSAHDTHFNRAIDKFFDEEGEEISTGDSIWNFHVWNEAWMARPDLPSGFGGWQALDATPQEESPQGGGYRLGPCPVQAVKLGHRVNFDVEFVISEVNADIRYYTIHEDRSRELTRTNTSHVGKNISTKAVGSNARNDLTLDYKFEEGSTSERAALLADSEGERSIGLTLSVDDNIMIGQDFFVRAELKNKTKQVKTFRLKLLGRAMLYTGAPGQQVKANEEEYSLKGGESTEMVLHVMPADYLRILEGGYFINFVAMAFIPADKLSVVRTREFRLRTPDILISLPEGGLKLHHAATIKVEFKNPLAKRLTHGRFYLHGEGFVQDTTMDISPVAPHGTAAAELLTIPLKVGKVDLVVRFTSDQLTDLLGDAEAVVAP